VTEGWYGDEYLVLFEQDAPALERAYGLAAALPDYRLVGLRGWDDFIVEDTAGARFTVPAVPLTSAHLQPFTVPETQPTPDDRVRGRIKWYVTPIVFGGDPARDDNVMWVSVDEHAQLVQWWNQRYREVSGRAGSHP
jgi:hypothetical protein